MLKIENALYAMQVCPGISQYSSQPPLSNQICIRIDFIFCNISTLLVIFLQYMSHPPAT